MALELPPRPGEVVCGKYRIETVIGIGGMGIVMRAVDTSLGRPIAIKFLAPRKATRDGAVARFIREARAAAALESEHVVRVFEVSTLPSGAPFIVMEHLRGADLSHVIRQRGALPIDEACDLVLQMCEALGEAHARGIVHRDLKPQNLFLTQRADGSPSVKVLDFGISKAAVDEGAPNLTSTDMVMGTPLYMSPEQVRSLKNVDARADVWALGVILFELLTTSPVFQAPSASALCAMIAIDPPTPLRARRPEAPAGLEDAILRCLHKDPAGRFQDVAQLAAALAPFASERGRQSVTRVSHVLRAATGPGTFGQGGHSGSSFPMAAHAASPMGLHAASIISTTGPGFPTAQDSSRASFKPPGMAGISNMGPGPSHAPLEGPHPTTQSSWHQTSAAGAPPEKRDASNMLVAMAGALTGLVLLAGVGGGVWYFVDGKDKSVGAATADASTNGATTVAMPAPTAAPVPTASATATSPSPSPKPGPAPAPSVADAGGGRVAPADAGVKKRWASAVPSYSGGSFAPYNVAKSRAEVERVIPALSVCFAATEFEPPDHQDTSWTLTIDPSGNVTSARRTTSYEPHPKLDPCVIRVLQTMKWQALPGGGSARISLTARTQG